MILRIIAAAAALCLAAGSAQAQTIAEMDPQTPGQSAAVALRGFCLPLFRGEGFTIPRATELMNGLGLMPLDGLAPTGMNASAAGFAAPSPAGTSVAVLWVPDENACQIQITGPGGVGLDLLASLEALGWVVGQQGNRTAENTIIDLWYAQTADNKILMAAGERWVGETRPEGDLQVSLTVTRVE